MSENLVKYFKGATGGEHAAKIFFTDGVGTMQDTARHDHSM